MRSLHSIKVKIQNLWSTWHVSYAIRIWLGWMIILTVVGAAIMAQVPVEGPIHNYYGISNDLAVWTNWDGNNYVTIARDGYGTEILPLYAFFPLFPFLMRGLVTILGVSYPMAGMIISRIATLGTLIFLIQLVEHRWGREVAYKSAWLLLIFPTSFFMMAVYTESLFLFLILASWYFTQQKNYLVASIFGFLAPLTRLVGGCIAPIILWKYLTDRKNQGTPIGWGIMTTLSPICGLVVYGYYNYIQTNNFLHFIDVQKYWVEHGRGGYHNPIAIIWDYTLRTIQSFPEDKLFIFGSFDFWFTIFALIILIWITVKKIFPFSYLFWSWSVLLIPIISGSLVSMPRYVLSFFPLYIILAIWSVQYSLFDKLYTLCSILLLATLYTMFLFQVWVA